MEHEKIIECKLIAALRDRAESVRIHRSSLSAISAIADLTGARNFEQVLEVVHDNSSWNPTKTLMKDVIGGMCPDIVLRSKLTGENRIYIEVKDKERLGYRRYGVEDSQVVRYFLHLLATTNDKKKDVGRAVLLCAPRQWFADRHNAHAWGYLAEHFAGVGARFNIAIGELYADDL